MEGARNGQRNGLDACGTAVFHQLVHTGNSTGHHNLARAVDIGRNHHARVLHGFAEFQNLRLILTHDGGHGAGVLAARAGHEFTAGTHQA